MLNDSIRRVDEFGERLKDRLQNALREWLQSIGIEGELLEELSLKKADKSDYWSAKVRGFDGNGNPIAVRKNWVQLNGQTHDHPSYSSPKPWKLLSRFCSPPSSLLWEKKPPYIHNRQPYLEWSPGGQDVWAVSYESLAEALSRQSESDVMDEIMEDLHTSWAYAFHIQLDPEFVSNAFEGSGSRGQQPPSQRPQYPTNNAKPGGGDRVVITLSINSAVWDEFRQIVRNQYRPRRKHPRRPSYAKLLENAIDSALMTYVNQWKGRGEDEDQMS
ncbi:MAG: hypothetical protein ACUVTR_02200 [Dehalococcoidia bacterium]